MVTTAAGLCKSTLHPETRWGISERPLPSPSRWVWSLPCYTDGDAKAHRGQRAWLKLSSHLGHHLWDTSHESHSLERRLGLCPSLCQWDVKMSLSEGRIKCLYMLLQNKIHYWCANVFPLGAYVVCIANFTHFCHHLYLKIACFLTNYSVI